MIKLNVWIIILCLVIEFHSTTKISEKERYLFRLLVDEKNAQQQNQTKPNQTEWAGMDVDVICVYTSNLLTRAFCV